MNKTDDATMKPLGSKIGAAHALNDHSAAIRTATAVDALALCNLMREYWEFEGIPHFDSARISTLLQTALSPGGGAYAWLAEDAEHQPLGYLFAVTQISMEYGGITAEIDELYVRQQFRGTGLGVALLNQAEQSLRTLAVCCLQLQLATDNLEAREFYRRHAFKRRAGYELWDKRLTAPPAPER